MVFTLRVIKDEWTPSLRRQMAILKNPQRGLRAMGTAMVSIAMRSFTDASWRPTAWAALSTRTLQQRVREKRGNRPLIRSGLLSRSPRVVQVTPRSVRVGSDRPYAKYQQLGTSAGVPARPFFPVLASGRLTSRANDLVIRAAVKALNLEGS